MPPTLDLSRTAHSKILISPSRMNLRRAASYNSNQDLRPPLSSTSSRFNFNHLVFSPPPSPGLPSLSPPPKKPARGWSLGRIHPIRVIRYTLRLLSVVVVFFIALQVLTWIYAPQSPKKSAAAAKGLGARGHAPLPASPTALVVQDSKGRATWTVSIPPALSFPLAMEQYSELTGRCAEASARVRQMRKASTGGGLLQAPLAFGGEKLSSAEGFIDVQEAQREGHLPLTVSVEGQGHHTEQLCKRSLTYVLESSDAGMGRTLMMLWMAYGLAEREGRAFFLDDSRWAYGKYEDLFQRPPNPGCAPPPRWEALPCPRDARHLVVSAATAEVVFGDLMVPTLSDHGQADGGMERSSQSQAALMAQFDLARHGYEGLFKLKQDDASYVDSRVRELMGRRVVPKTRGQLNGLAIGLHVRRGDRHPLEYPYQESYLPLSVYADVAHDIIESHFNHTAVSSFLAFGGGGGSKGRAQDIKEAKAHSFTIVASDDPTIYTSAELRGTEGSVPAQTRVKLPGKPQAQPVDSDRGVMHKFVEEKLGWEGGFFASLFWNLGVGSKKKEAASTTNAGGKVARKEALSPSEETLRLRIQVGRAYMMDLAVLADASDAIVCTVSAMGCRLLGVMMGWENIMAGRWVNVDGGYGWMGLEELAAPPRTPLI